MTLTQHIQRATRQNRRRQSRAEARMDEQLLLEVARTQLTEEWSAADATGDRRFTTLARQHYETLTSDEQRASMERLFAEWSRDEAMESRVTSDARATNLQTIVTFRRNTPLFVDGAFVPENDGGAA